MSELNLPDNAQLFGYDRDAITTGIVHFGVGNFHRAHQAVYVDDLLNQGATGWGITGVSLRSSSIKNALSPQDCLYTLAILGETTEYRIIGSIKNVLAAPDDPAVIIDCLASPATQLVSTTITEKGYYLGTEGVDFTHADLQAEQASLEMPITLYGFLACGIIKRAQNSDEGSKLTILCCDNISGGGEFIKYGVEHLLAIHDNRALAWSKQNVAFLSSMVDRVCPATNDGLKSSVAKDIQQKDAWPVSAEPFSQWIIEKGFSGLRPAFDRLGAVFVDDIAPFERMKLGYLNCAHTIISTLGYLSGDDYVHQALGRAEILNFVRHTLYENILPNVRMPNGYDGADYIENVIKRFQNGKLPYGNLQVGTDSSQKIQQRWFPTIDQALANNSDASYFQFCIGAWVVFIKMALENGDLNDPKIKDFKKAISKDIGSLVKPYLAIANADSFNFYQSQSFMKSIEKYAEQIQYQGISRNLATFLNRS